MSYMVSSMIIDNCGFNSFIFYQFLIILCLTLHFCVTSNLPLRDGIRLNLTAATSAQSFFGGKTFIGSECETMNYYSVAFMSTFVIVCPAAAGDR